MSRSNYSDDCEHLGLWRGAVDRATFGVRGQAFLRRLADALDALPSRRLIQDKIQDSSGDVCALGALDPKAPHYDAEDLARHFGIAYALAAEIVYMNDERFGGEWTWAEGPDPRPPYPSYQDHRGVWTYVEFTPEVRYMKMREWVNKQIPVEG